tara:strand:- start:3358 stop:3729 length:372 start_codon:yes stop_codon:yes gene_type:complete
MAKKKIVASNAYKRSRKDEAEARAKELKLPPKGLKVYTDAEIEKESKRQDKKVSKDNTKKRTTAMENKGKKRSAGLPVSEKKRDLAGELKYVNKNKDKTEKKKKIDEKKKLAAKKAKTKKRKT